MVAPKRLQLDFIDGLRALAALYIVFHHCFVVAEYFPPGFSFMDRGHDVVAVFIAISGFCLALPLAQRGNWKLQIGQFFQRRGRRILPPYFATLAIALLIALAFSYKSYPQDYAGVRITWLTVISHVLLFHNWTPADVYTLDGPLWSIAVECQIYLVFPLLVLLWGRTGKWVTLFVTFVVAHGLLYLAHSRSPVNFLFLFAEGMLGAELAFSSRHNRWLGPVFLLCVIGYLFTDRYQRDIFTGLGIGLLMAYLAQHREHWGNRVLGWKPLAWIGTFSYSIYLLHAIIQIPVKRWLFSSGIKFFTESHTAMLALLVFVVSPIAIAASYGFHLVFERPFLSQTRKKAEERFAAGTVTPAITAQIESQP
jgi:peptidoglycan/LPS O-acetylase OafA/YrhL